MVETGTTVKNGRKSRTLYVSFHSKMEAMLILTEV